MHSVVKIFAVLSLVLLTKTAVSCPDTYHKVSGYCFKFVHTHVKWSQAWQYCKAEGGYQAILSSAAKMDILRSYLNRNDDQNTYWVGAVDAFSDDEWMWVESGELADTYVNWCTPFTPVDSRRNCMLLDPEAGNFCWDHNDCNEAEYYKSRKPISFICETEPSGRSIFNTPTADKTKFAFLKLNNLE